MRASFEREIAEFLRRVATDRTEAPPVSEWKEQACELYTRMTGRAPETQEG